MLRKLFASCTPCFAILLLIASSHRVAAQTRPPEPLVVTGPDQGHAPVVNIFVQGLGGIDMISFLAYAPSFTGGVRVATGDINGDGVDEIITAPGPGMGPHVRIFDLESRRRLRGPMGSFLAYSGNFQGGVFVAAGDVNGDGRADIITGPGAGAPPLVRVFDGMTGNLLLSFFAFDPSFLGGVRVAAGDVNGDGLADIITGTGPGVAPHVRVFSPLGPNVIHDFVPFDSSFLGGVFVAAGDVNGDGFADIIVGAGAGGGPLVKVFDAHDNLALLDSFFAFNPTFTGGVRVAAGDVNGDSFDDIITGAGSRGNARVVVFDPENNLNVLDDFFAYPNFRGGVFVAGFSTPQRR